MTTDSSTRNKGISRDDVIRLRRELGMTQQEIADELGVSKPTVQYHLKRAAMSGQIYPTKGKVIPGFEVSRLASQLDKDGSVEREWIEQKPERGPEFEMPAGHVVKGVSALVDGDGRVIQQWTKTREDRLDTQAIVESLRTAFEGYDSPHVPHEAPAGLRDDLLTILPANDWHIGMFAWGKEVGQNWDLKIAERKIMAGITDALLRSPAAGTCVVLGGGDLLHADNQENRTAKSGNQLDVDGRYPKVMQAAARMMVLTIEAALRKHGRVVVRVLPGNHDEHTSHCLAFYLWGHFHRDKRVEVDLDPGLFWFYRFGAVQFGATHGHTVKIEKMAEIMAHRRPADWGASRFRYVHGFHLHHHRKIATEGSGVISEVHQAPIPQDAWHYGSGFLSGRSVQTITYHRELGEVSRVRVALVDC